MTKFKIKLRHTVEQYYIAIVDAKTEEEAEELFENNPFDYVEDEEPYDEQSLKIEIVSINKKPNI